MIRRSFKFSTLGFTLASGRVSPYYVNCKPVTYDPRGRVHIANIITGYWTTPPFTNVGGLASGADPIAIAVSDMYHRKGHAIYSFSIRKEPKGHGTKEYLEGYVNLGSNRTMIVEDVITTGGSTLKAIERAIGHGLDVVQIFALVDRQEGGVKAIREKYPKIPLASIFTKEELMNEWQKQQKGTQCSKNNSDLS
jgi:orotate phosphoribosyltransferase